MNWRRAVIPTLFILPILGVLALGFGNDPHALPSVHEGRSAPTFSLVDLQGNAVDLAALKGKPVVLNFWSTWCEPCKYEAPVLQRGASTYAGKVAFLGVIYQDEPHKVTDYLRRQPLGFPQLVDPASRTAIEYGVSGVPETFFIDAQGVVHHKETGVVGPELLHNTIAKMTGGNP